MTVCGEKFKTHFIYTNGSVRADWPVAARPLGRGRLQPSRRTRTFTCRPGGDVCIGNEVHNIRNEMQRTESYVGCTRARGVGGLIAVCIRRSIFLLIDLLSRERIKKKNNYTHTHMYTCTQLPISGRDLSGSADMTTTTLFAIRVHKKARIYVYAVCRRLFVFLLNIRT